MEDILLPITTSPNRLNSTVQTIFTPLTTTRKKQNKAVFTSDSVVKLTHALHHMIDSGQEYSIIRKHVEEFCCHAPSTSTSALATSKRSLECGGLNTRKRRIANSSRHSGAHHNGVLTVVTKKKKKIITPLNVVNVDFGESFQSEM